MYYVGVPGAYFESTPWNCALRRIRPMSVTVTFIHENPTYLINLPQCNRKQLTLALNFNITLILTQLTPTLSLTLTLILTRIIKKIEIKYAKIEICFLIGQNRFNPQFRGVLTINASLAYALVTSIR
jgi:hypothetical protein